VPPFAIEWNGIPHNLISLPHGKWRFPERERFGAMIFQIVHTAREMGITVSEFLQLPDDEKALQLVYSNLISKIEQVNIQDRQDEARRSTSRGARR
jgi:hypothetical protein